MSSGMIPAQPERILRALGQVWTSLGEEERHQGKPTVLRACAMTLIVVTDAEDTESANAMQMLGELMPSHPSRAIILKADKKTEDGLSARVFAQCWKPFGKAQQICCEQIEVSVRPERWAEVGPTILGIVVPDLPVVVWCRLPSVLKKEGDSVGPVTLEPVLSVATKIIVDTRGTEFAHAYGVLKHWMAEGYGVGDLEWTRLTPWRETLATIFDEHRALLGGAESDSIEIGYTGSQIPASAYHLAAWLGRGIKAKPRFKQEEGSEPALTRLTMNLMGKTVQITHSSGTCLRLNVSDVEQRVSLAGAAFYDWMHEELTVLGHDAVFEWAFNRTGDLTTQ